MVWYVCRYREERGSAHIKDIPLDAPLGAQRRKESTMFEVIKGIIFLVVIVTLAISALLLYQVLVY